MPPQPTPDAWFSEFHQRLTLAAEAQTSGQLAPALLALITALLLGIVRALSALAARTGAGPDASSPCTPRRPPGNADRPRRPDKPHGIARSVRPMPQATPPAPHSRADQPDAGTAAPRAAAPTPKSCPPPPRPRGTLGPRDPPPLPDPACSGRRLGTR